jgi:predicted AAA+ superfamily ATPase
MERFDVEMLYNTFYRKLSKVSLQYTRYLYDEINWNVRLIGIKGARGVGKTTMLLQRIKRVSPDGSSTFYVSLDDLWFESHSLPELAEYLYTHGVSVLYLDEVHRYPNWSLTLKNINDNYPDLSIVYTGSSMLEIDNSTVDLSRRQTVYEMRGFSFREYLAFEGLVQLSPVPLEELLQRHVGISMELTHSIKVLPWFEKYLKCGYYPFYKDAADDYMLRLQEVVALILDADLPAVESVEYATVQKAKKMLMLLAERVPLIPNISRLCEELGTTRDVGIRMLYALARAGLLQLLLPDTKSYKTLSRPDKIYLHNTNLMYALTSRVEKGTLRETFFLNQVGGGQHSVGMPPAGDFFVDKTYLFEVGGKGKSFDQIKNIPNSYLAVDEIEYGHGNRIPLWAFGLLY